MTTTVGMFFVITAFYPSLIIPAVSMILVMAFSRLHNGMHYPSDILAGVALGLGYGWIALEIVRVMF
jgi:undecaprenyl-diphosphatase